MFDATFLIEGIFIIGISVILPLIAVIVFAAALYITPFTKNEDAIQAWDVFLKGIGTLTAIIAGVLAVLQYIHTTKLTASADATRREHETKVQQQELAQKTREFNINLYKNQDKRSYKETLYHEAVDVAATLANGSSPESPDVKIARDRFLRLYSGQLVVVKEELVREAMTDFRAALFEWEKTRVKPPIDGKTAFKLLQTFPKGDAKTAAMLGEQSSTLEEANEHLRTSPGNRMEALCLLLAEACRKELQQDERIALYDVLADDLGDLMFHAELMQEWYANNWTSLKELEAVVNDYNLIIAKVRKQAQSRRPKVASFWSNEIANDFDTVMKDVRKLDEIIHSLNKETGQVAQGKKEQADPALATKTAQAITEQLKVTKPRVETLLTKMSTTKDR